MATMTVSLPDLMQEWIETQVTDGSYASSSAYVCELIRRDRERRGPELTVPELRDLVADARASGIGTGSIDDIFARAREIAHARGTLRG